MDSNKQGTTEGPKEINDIRVGMGSRVRNVIRYCNSVLNEKKVPELKFSAVGGAIGKLVDAVEVLKIVNPGLYQISKIATVSYQTVDSQGGILNQRLYPKLEVILTLERPKETGEGFQEPIPEEERKKYFDLLNNRPERTQGDDRGRGRGSRGGFRGRGRGGPRGSFRGQRGGFREESFRGGHRGAPRGGFREEGFRGGFREEGFRGGQRGGPRGGQRGAPRGGFRGAPRGAPRGGFRGTPRGGRP